MKKIDKATGRRTWGRKDVTLNVNPKEAIIRLVIALALPISIAWLNSTFFIILICVISGYLFITVLTLFCYVKYWWRHFVKKRYDPEIKDPDMPVKEL